LTLTVSGHTFRSHNYIPSAGQRSYKEPSKITSFYSIAAGQDQAYCLLLIQTFELLELGIPWS